MLVGHPNFQILFVWWRTVGTHSSFGCSFPQILARLLGSLNRMVGAELLLQLGHLLPEANHFRFDFFLAHSGLWRLQICFHLQSGQPRLGLRNLLLAILDGGHGLLELFRAFLEVVLARLGADIHRIDFGLPPPPARGNPSKRPSLENLPLRTRPTLPPTSGPPSERPRTSRRDPIAERGAAVVALVLRVMNLPNPTGDACPEAPVADGIAQVSPEATELTGVDRESPRTIRKGYLTLATRDVAWRTIAAKETDQTAHLSQNGSLPKPQTSLRFGGGRGMMYFLSFLAFFGKFKSKNLILNVLCCF